MSGKDRAAMVSRRQLLREMVSRVARWAGAESAVLPPPASWLRVPYVPYTARPTEPRRSPVEEARR